MKESMTKALIRTQYKERYGCEDNVGDSNYGRYKNKGGMDYVIDIDTHTLLYNEEAVVEAFHKEYNKEGAFTRCEVIEIEGCYFEPKKIQLEL